MILFFLNKLKKYASKWVNFICVWHDSCPSIVSHLPHSSRQIYLILPCFMVLLLIFLKCHKRRESTFEKNRNLFKPIPWNCHWFSEKQEQIQFGLLIHVPHCKWMGMLQLSALLNPIIQHTCPLCLCELGVDHVSWLNQRSAGLDHLEDKEYMALVCNSIAA